MNYISLDLTIKYAEIFKNVNHFSKTHIYAVVTLMDRSVSMNIATHKHRGSNHPTWFAQSKFHIEASRLHQNNLMLVLQVKSKRPVLGNKDLGLVYLPVKELFDKIGKQKYPEHVAYDLNSSSGKLRGVLYLSYMFTDGECTDQTVHEANAMAPPRPTPSAPYLPEDEYFPANPNPSAPCVPIDNIEYFPSKYTPSAPLMEENRLWSSEYANQ